MLKEIQKTPVTLNPIQPNPLVTVESKINEELERPVDNETKQEINLREDIVPNTQPVSTRKPEIKDEFTKNKKSKITNESDSINKNCDQIKKDIEDKLEKITKLNSKIDIDYKELQALYKCTENENKENFNELMKDKNNPINFLYPHLDDTENFNIKIASKKEFSDTQYPLKTQDDIENIKEKAQEICDSTEFELEPHQRFVRNFYPLKHRTIVYCYFTALVLEKHVLLY